MRTHHVALALAAAALMALACSKSSTSTGPTAAPEEQGGTTQTTSAGKVDMTAAREVFNSRCSACHGTSGRGEGPGAAALTPKPRNYTDATWQASVSDEQIKKTNLLGGAAVGGLVSRGVGRRRARARATAEIGCVPARALELETGGGHLLAEAFRAAGGASRQGGVGDLLQDILGMATGAAFVRVDGHGSSGGR